MSVEIGQVVDGKYRITRLIGQGGMGAVYEGIHTLIDRKVAIKVLLPSTDPTAAGRFEQEARAAGRIGNDHILEVLDIGDLPDKSKYMVCEFLDGQPLSSLIAEKGVLSPQELAPLILQLLTGLGAAHRAEVLHRDLKPDNIFVLHEKAGKKDFVKIIDFGISKFSQLDGGDGLSMTKTGMLVGTPNYMSPEQARGKGGVDARADIYAVGVMMYEAVSGTLPFDAETFNDLLFKVVLEEPPPLSELVPGLDPKFAAIIEKAMAKEPADRYSDAVEFAQDLSGWTKGTGGLGAQTVQVAMTPSLMAMLDSPGQALPQAAAQEANRASYPSISGAGRQSSIPPSAQETAPTEKQIPRYETVGAPTPGAFGSTGTFDTSSPWWQDRRVQIGGGVAALVLLLVIVFASTSGEETAAAESPAEESDPATKIVVPELEPAKPEADEKEAEKVAQPQEPVEEPPEEHKTPEKVTAPPAVKAPTPVPKPVVRTAPRAVPAPKPKRPNFGY